MPEAKVLSQSGIVTGDFHVPALASWKIRRDLCVFFLPGGSDSVEPSEDGSRGLDTAGAP